MGFFRKMAEAFDGYDERREEQERINSIEEAEKRLVADAKISEALIVARSVASRYKSDYGPGTDYYGKTPELYAYYSDLYQKLSVEIDLAREKELLEENTRQAVLDDQIGQDDLYEEE
jgi:hypothetical protein